MGQQPGSVENALRTLQLLRDRRSLRVAELATELGVARSTAHRLLSLLSSYGAVEQEPGTPLYRAGPLLAQLSLSSLPQHNLVEIVHPFLQELSDAVDETAHLIVLHGQQSVFLDSVECRRQTLRVSARVGVAYPAYATSGGKVLLAALTDAEIVQLFGDSEFSAQTERTIRTLDALLTEVAEIRGNGYATNWGENGDGVAAVAVTLRRRDGQVAGALTISVPEQRLPLSRLSALVRTLREFTDKITPKLS